LEGKMSPPTVPPHSARERRGALNEAQRGKRRRSFLIGLVVGQILVVGLSFGGEALLQLRPDLKLTLSPRVLVWAGVTSGIVFTGILIGFLMTVQALVYMIRPRGKPLGTALGNGVKRIVRATLSLATTLIVLSGSALATIPYSQWRPEGERLWKEMKQAVDRLIKATDRKS